MPVLLLAIVLVLGIVGYLALDWYVKHRDLDSDGIADYLEETKYQTDTLNPNYLLSYVLK
jgi:hypothetical protein